MNIKDKHEMSQREVGEALGMSRGMVGHIETAALEKIKRELERRGIKAFDLIETKHEQ